MPPCIWFSSSVSQSPLFLATHITIAWLSSKQSGKGKAISIPKKSRVCPLPDARSDPVIRHPSEAEWIRAQGCCLLPSSALGSLGSPWFLSHHCLSNCTVAPNAHIIHFFRSASFTMATSRHLYARCFSLERLLLIERSSDSFSPKKGKQSSPCWSSEWN